MIWNAGNGQVRLDGTAMSFVSFGYGEKALIVLPGLSDGLATVRGKALLLAKPYRQFFERYTVYMFSRKDDMPQGYSIRAMAADQARAMQILGVEKASVLGVSQGGMIALCLAIDHPQMVSRLAVAVSAPGVNDVIRQCVPDWIAFAEQGDHRRLMIDTAEKSYSERYLKKYRKLYFLLGRLGRPADYGRFLINARAILSFDVSRELRSIACPALIIGALEDRIVGADASREMARQIPESELYLYSDLGHAAYEEAKDFNDRVYRFLEGSRQRL